jgi:hypothetical protein
MDRIAFIYPGSQKHDALDNWVCALARHAPSFQIRLRRRAVDVLDDEWALLITEAGNYPRIMVDRDMAILERRRLPFGVVHNNDCVPTPGNYPSFCWTVSGLEKMAEYNPVLLRQPVFPPIVPFERQNLLVGTFGHVEPKKQIREMFHWSRKEMVPFRVFGPSVLLNVYADYVEGLMNQGCTVTMSRWKEKIEDWAELLCPVSHFLFVLPESKGGTGGSPTSPRFAGLFHRPVIVIDNENIFLEDRFYVYDALDKLHKDDLESMKTPGYSWSPDVYLKEIMKTVKGFWGK